MLDIAKLILILVGMYVIFNVLMSFVLKASQKSVEKQFETRILTDQQVLTFYQTAKKASNRGVLKRILFYGIFYSTQTKHNKKITQLYENEIKKRKLL